MRPARTLGVALPGVLLAALVAVSSVAGASGGPDARSTGTTSTTAPSSSSTTEKASSASGPAPGHRPLFPTLAKGCRAGQPPKDTATAVPMFVAKGKGRVIALVPVCVNGRGPYPFILDTGNTGTTFDSALATSLHLHTAGSTDGQGVGCAVHGSTTTVAHWSLGDVTLSSEKVQVVKMPGFGVGRGQPAGSLGSDILDRFGAVRIGYRDQRLTVPGPEGPAISARKVIKGPTSGATPSVLTTGRSGTTVPLHVLEAPRAALAVAPVSFHSLAPLSFVLDTGSTGSAVSEELAHRLGLRSAHHTITAVGVGCTSRASLVHSGSWSLWRVPLAPERLAAVSFGGGRSSQTVPGLLGSDELSRFGWVVVDYAHGRLILGTAHQGGSATP
jgi:predicted aspartyl protease